jgi:hypothetical protein
MEMENPEDLVKDDSFLQFNPDCIRKKSNWSKSAKEYKFDSEDFNPEQFLKDIQERSPKLHALLDKIEKLDAADHDRDGHYYKHFIFCDLKSGNYGAKMLAAAFIAKDMTMGYTAPKNPEKNGKPLKKKKIYGKIAFVEKNKLTKERSFFLLSSVSVFDQPISVANKKQILATFNKRPDNIHGEDIRFIIMDSGFKEGIDLFDIKYVHIFEPSVNSADQKQVIGRGTRTCGQKGLIFHPTQGWPLHVFIYDLSIPEELQHAFLGAKSTHDLYLKSLNIDLRMFEFNADLEKTVIFGSVDHELTENIHSFVSGNDELVGGGEHYPPGTQKNYNSFSSRDLMMEKGKELEFSRRAGGGKGEPGVPPGGGPKKKRLVIDRTLPPLIINTKGDKPVLAYMNGQDMVELGGDREPMTFQEMRQYIRNYFSDTAWGPAKMENLCEEAKAKAGGAGGQLITYSPTQEFVRRYFTPQAPVKGMLLWHSVGTGKCHALNTPILMFDGSIKKVQDIIVGDKLMGDDSTPREVLSLARGQDTMYDIVPVKGEKYTVNSEHILCLKFSGKGSISHLPHVHKTKPYVTRIFDKNARVMKSQRFDTRKEAEDYLSQITEEDKISEITVIDYLKLPQSCQNELKGYRKGVDFEYKPVDFDPYIFGAWLGDGTSRDPKITTQESKMIKYLNEKLPEYGLRLVYESQYDYRMSCNDTTRANLFMRFMKKYNLVNNKHIPQIYKCNDRNIRLQLLAGIIDTDGYYCKRGKMFSITQKSDILTSDILFLGRSLGFACYSNKQEKSWTYKGEKKKNWYNMIKISGNGLDEIPTLLTRKQAEKRCQIKDALVTGIKVWSVGKGDYYGFTLDGNNRYLLGDFTVTHNTCSAIAAATSSFEPQGYTILWVTRTTLKNDIWKNMFDQVCSEVIKRRIQNENLVIPDDNSKRMKLLSKSWKIRPLSYKQFSNLVSKENNFYKSLVSINGKEDPLRKTLLIIDEAHKLYGGGDAVLSSAERPNMAALHSSLMNSYTVSGSDSVRLLLMTATPITDNPMELIKLINLCKPSTMQLPDEFPTFSDSFLNMEGHFSEQGRHLFLDKIAGYVSYLNREKDARQFSQPRIQYIMTPVVQNVDKLLSIDRRFARGYYDKDVLKLKNKILEENGKIDADLKDLHASRFHELTDRCDEFEGYMRKDCKKVAKATIRELAKEAREHTKKIRETIKNIRKEIRDKNIFKRDELKKLGKADPTDLDAFKASSFYQLKYKCGKKIRPDIKLKEASANDPQIVELTAELEAYDSRIKQMEDGLRSELDTHNARIKRIKNMLRSGDLNDLEKNVLKLTMADARKTHKVSMKLKKKTTDEVLKDLNKTKKSLEKDKKKRYVSIRKSLKKSIRDSKKAKREALKAEKELRKTMKKQEKIHEEIKSDVLKDLVHKYKDVLEERLGGVEEELEEKAEAKMALKKAKEDAKAVLKIEKAKAKEEVKKAKEEAKALEKAEKLKKKEEEKTRKLREKQELKEKEKAEKKLANKTRKERA